MRSRGKVTKIRGCPAKTLTVKKIKISRRKTDKPKYLSIKFRMNKDERNDKKRKITTKKRKKKKQKPNQRESDKKKGAGQLVVHLSLSVVFFGGVEKITAKCLCML